MEYAAGPPTKWILELVDSSEISVWADGFTEVDHYLIFSVLVDATEEEQFGLEVIARTPSRPERVAVTVARIPVEAVTSESPWSA